MKQITYKRFPLGNQRFHWKQKEFTLSTFTCAARDMEKAIQNWIELGMNLAELGWATHERAWQAVDLCEKHGLDLLFQDLSLMGGMSNLFMDRPVNDDTIREVATKLKDKKHTVGIYVWDEPDEDITFTESRRQSDILHAIDPEALLFTVFVPSYNAGPTWYNGQYADRFDEYIRRLEPPVLSFDHYPIGDYFKMYPGHVYEDGRQLDEAVMWCDLALARKLSLKYDLPFWFYYQGCALYECTDKFEYAMIRMMMHAAILYGAKGLQMYAVGVDKTDGYLSGEHIITADGDKGVFFEDHKKTQHALAKLGNTLMALTSRKVYHSSDLMPFGIHGPIYESMADSIADSDILAGELPRRCSVGELSDNYGNRYLYILNRDFYQNLNATLALKGNYNLYEVSPADGKQHLIQAGADSIPVSLIPGDALLLRVQNAGEEPFLVDYELE